MRFGLGLAVSVSVLLIAIASWTRFGQAQEYQPGLVTVTQPVENSDEYYKQIADAFLSEGNHGTTTEEALTGTDIIGRQLLFDYIELATSGKATEQSINELAQRYVESIPTLIQNPKITALELKIIPNTSENLNTYEKEMTGILNDHASKISTSYTQSSRKRTPSDTYRFAGTISQIYEKTSLDLKSISVPGAIVPAHLKLINNYLSTGAAMKSISNADQDSAEAFAALISMSTNSGQEISILNEINTILAHYGL